MTTRQINVQQLTVISSKPFAEISANIEAAVGRPDMTPFGREVSAAKTYQESENVI
jgi:hypothetical protein